MEAKKRKEARSISVRPANLGNFSLPEKRPPLICLRPKSSFPYSLNEDILTPLTRKTALYVYLCSFYFTCPIMSARSSFSTVCLNALFFFHCECLTTSTPVLVLFLLHTFDHLTRARESGRVSYQCTVSTLIFFFVRIAGNLMISR
jgi:hypothetical protein